MRTFGNFRSIMGRDGGDILSGCAVQFIVMMLAVGWIGMFSKGQTIVGERMELADAFLVTVKHEKAKIVKDFVKEDVVAPLANTKTALVSSWNSATTGIKSYLEKIKQDRKTDTL